MIYDESTVCSTSNVGVITFNDFVTGVVGSLEYCSEVASTVGATGKPQLVLCS